jgi:hypothetical protein
MKALIAYLLLSKRFIICKKFKKTKKKLTIINFGVKILKNAES